MLGIIPARAGSKGVVGKNLKLLGGKPLIAWTIEAALKSGCFDRVIVSTDCEEIARVGRQCGAETPFLRPAAFASDDASMSTVVQHALSVVSEYDRFLLLQPTSPLRDSADISRFVRFFSECRTHRAISIVESLKSPFWSMTIEGGVLRKCFEDQGEVRRQELPNTYLPNGAIYGCDVGAFQRDPVFFDNQTSGFLMGPEKSIDIDSDYDFLLAEALISFFKCHSLPS